MIRIELDKDKVAAKRVQLEDLQRIIVDVFGQGTFQIIISDQNMPRQVRGQRFGLVAPGVYGGVESDGVAIHDFGTKSTTTTPTIINTTTPPINHHQVLRLRFVPEGDDEDDVDIDFLKSVEEQIRTKLKVGRVLLVLVWGILLGGLRWEGVLVLEMLGGLVI